MDTHHPSPEDVAKAAAWIKERIAKSPLDSPGINLSRPIWELIVRLLNAHTIVATRAHMPPELRGYGVRVPGDGPSDDGDPARSPENEQ